MKTLLTLSMGFVCILYAAPSASSNYTVPADSIDTGGSIGTSTDYTNCGSLGGIAGISTVVAPAETAKAGYIGQLYEMTGLQLAAAPTNVHEGATTQLSATQLLDDDTFLAVATTSVNWSVASGPLVSIDTTGEGTADIVYENTPATAQGHVGGLTNQIILLVLDASPDNYGSYAGDGIDDDWQYLYFGLDNPDAGPLLDPDHDLQNNKFEFVAGLNPTDYASRFLLAIKPAGTDQQDIIFSPRYSDQTYTVLYTTNLVTGSWSPLTSFSISDDSTVRTVTDLLATEDSRFYNVEITRP